MRSRNLTTFVIGMGLVAATAGTAMAQTVIMATDRQGSLMNRVGSTMAKAITDNSPARVIVRPFAGPDAYMDSLNRGEIKLATLTASSVYIEVKGQNKTKRARKNMRMLRCGPNVIRLGFIVRKDSDIKEVSQLKGRKVTSDFGGHAVLPRSIAAGLSAGGLTWDDVVKVPVTGVVDGVKSVGQGRTESSWAPVGMPAVREVNAQVGVRFLSFPNTPENLKKMREIMYPGMKLVTVKKLPPLSVMHDVNLITYDTCVVANKDLDDATATKIVEGMWKGTDEIVKSSPIMRGFSKKTAATDLPMSPYHPAAVAFYKKQGVWTDAIDKGNEAAKELVK